MFLTIPVFALSIVLTHAIPAPPPDVQTSSKPPTFIPEDSISREPLAITPVTSDAVANKAQILSDLDKYDAALISSSQNVTDIMQSDEMFKLMRNVFTSTSDEFNELRDSLQVFQVMNQHRASFRTEYPKDWLQKQTANPSLQKLQAVSKAFLRQSVETYKAIMGIGPGPAADALVAKAEIYWIPPDENAVQNPDSRGLHVDPGTLSLISSDQPGLIIKSPDPNTTLTRVPVSPDTWYIIKNTGFQRNNPSVIPNTGPTRHTVFGPEIVKNGRVSIVTDVAVLTRKTVRMYGTWYSPAADNAGNGSGGGDSAGTVATS